MNCETDQMQGIFATDRDKKQIQPPHEKWPYSELFCPYSVWMRENTDQNNFEYGHFLRSEHYCLLRITRQIFLTQLDFFYK